MSRNRIVVAAVASLVALSVPAEAQRSVRIGVLSLDYSAVKAAANEALKADVDVGSGVADVLTQHLVEVGGFTVVERKAISSVLDEQNLSNSNRADDETAARIGRLLGVDVILVGGVTEFSVEERTIAAPGLGRFTRGIVGGVGRKQAKARVSITARIVNTSTGEIVSGVVGDGEVEDASFTLTGGAVGAIDMMSDAFSGTLIGKALDAAAHDVAQQLTEAAAGKLATRMDYAGVVADVSGRTIIVNAGAKAGVRVGDRIEISRVVRSVPDPQNPGRILRTISETVANGDVTEVDEESATATVGGDTAVNVGDSFKRAQ